jgi:hypothetical protein
LLKHSRQRTRPQEVAMGITRRILGIIRVAGDRPFACHGDRAVF